MGPVMSSKAGDTATRGMSGWEGSAMDTCGMGGPALADLLAIGFYLKLRVDLCILTSLEILKIPRQATCALEGQKKGEQRH